MKYLAIVGVLLAILAGYGKSMYEWGRSDEKVEYNDLVRSVTKEKNVLTARLNKEVDKNADTNRKLLQTEQARIRAIRATSNQSEKIKHLENKLKGFLELEDKGNGDDLHYRIILTNNLNRVFNESRQCGLPESDSPSILQKRLPEVTGDDIAEVIKTTVSEYCSCGLKYNDLWRRCETLIN